MERGMIRKFGWIVLAIVILYCGGSYVKRWHSALMFNHYMNTGRQHLAYFNISPDKREGGDEEALRQAQLATDNFEAAKGYGEPGYELDDASIKLAAYITAKNEK